MNPKPSVLVLGGGPDAEREVSLVSSRAVADALFRAGHAVHYHVIDKPTLDQLAAFPGEVVFPVLHGGWGEGGPLQDLLAQLGRPFVGSKAPAARLAMDKLGTKLAAARAGIPTADALALNLRDHACPIAGFPVVAKPIHEGSSVGVHICRSPEDWSKAHAAILRDVSQHPHRVYMVERAVLPSTELTVGILDGSPLDPIEIRPAVEFYDYQAKYTRDDTRYLVDPDLPPGVKTRVQGYARTLASALGVRHLARIDFLMEPSGALWLLEANTMPGFTDHSLLPMAAAHRGLPMPELCTSLVSMAVRDR